MSLAPKEYEDMIRRREEYIRQLEDEKAALRRALEERDRYHCETCDRTIDYTPKEG